MAGGRGNVKQNVNLDKTCQWLCHRHLRSSILPGTFFNERFKKRQTVERTRTISKSIAIFHEHILRLYTNPLFSDFHILHGHNVIRTNQCIVKTRSPYFYEVLKPYFVHNNKTVECVIDSPGIFHQIKHFLRLLYKNLDVTRDEHLLVDAIVNVLSTSQYVDNFDANNSSDANRRICKNNIRENSRNIERYALVDISPASSDMADSGLETGSVSPHDNTTSENSSTDLEELQTAGNACINDDVDKIQLRRKRDKIRKTCVSAEQCDTSSNCSGYGTRDLVDPLLTECMSNDHSAAYSSAEVEHHHLDSSTSSNENAQKEKSQADEICQYENQVLSDPFYESDCASDENESFEFINPSNISSLSTDAEKETAKCESSEEKFEEKSGTVCKTGKDTVKGGREDSPVSVTFQDCQSFSSTGSQHFFIDASTLNDEIDVLATERTKDRYAFGISQSYSSHTTEYTPSRSSHTADDQFYKYTAIKPLHQQSGHKEVAEFERELKLTEYLKPLSESRKVKRVDSNSEEKVDTDKSTDKESLVVEIKEADSGESTQHSPLPDNNANISDSSTEITRKEDNRANPTVKPIDDGQEEIHGSKSSEKNENSNNEARRPSLIRGNTFELDSNNEKLSVLRQEYERRQGNLVFKNSIPQYSGHRVDGDSCFNPPTESPVPRITETVNTYASDCSVPATSQYHVTSCLSLDNCKFDDGRRPENTYHLETDGDKSKVIYPVTKSASDKRIPEAYDDVDNTSDNCSNSLPVTLSSIIEMDKRLDSIKRTKRDEATPIISGGASTSDYKKATDSPTVRRKTESTPIVSGGSVIMNEPEMKTKSTRMSSSMTAWVVDMSDCVRNDSKSTELSVPEGMSQSFSTSEYLKKPGRKISGQEKQGGLGFFVNLKDMDAKKDNTKQVLEKKEQNGSGKPYCEFYVDVSTRNGDAKGKKMEMSGENDEFQSATQKSDKKNIFSMFIDLSDPQKPSESNVATVQKKNFPTDKRAEQKLEDTNSSETSSGTQEDQSTENRQALREKPKPSVFMFIDSDSPVVRRRTLSSSRPAFKRHSWNIDKTQTANVNGHVAKEIIFRKEHKRAHSLSVDQGDLNKIQAKASSSSLSLSDVARAESANTKGSSNVQEQENNRTSNMDTSSEDVFEFDNRNTPPNSHIEVINEELRITVRHQEYKELANVENRGNVEMTESKVFEDEYSETSAWEKTCTDSTEGQTRKSETFDISSGSGPSSGSDNHDFELSDLLNPEMPNVNEKSKAVPLVGKKIAETHKSLNETIKKIESELESPEYVKVETYSRHSSNLKREERPISKGSDPGTASCSFVRLSDLDDSRRDHVSEIVSIKEDRASYRMSNSIPETSWIESKLVMGRSNVAPIRAIPRKFTSVMSTSLPAKQKSPLEDFTGDGEAEGIISESDLSSMQSSMGRSGAEGSTEETETSSIVGAKPYNRLGEDLLRMFLEEINPDVTIDVGGRRIRAHKCILSSRCQYFAAILSGGWVESAGNVISLEGYSYNAVHFALCHIYSGESNIPDSISIVELATLADMLCLEGLKEVIGYTLKVKYCHLFHKPCQICAVGVLECMPLAATYGLDEVYRKSLRWITRHFVRIWPCKAFASLPRQLMEKCYHQHIVHMSTDNVLQTMMDSDKLLATLPNVRWAEPVFRMVSNLLETSVKFLSDNFAGVLGNENFQSLGKELTWNISRLEDNFLAAAERLPPEQACKSYSKLHKMLASTQLEDHQAKPKWGPLFIEFLKKIQCRVEKCLIRDAARAARTNAWLKMDLELRRRIQELACLVILPHETSKRPSRHSNFLKEPKAPSNRSTTSRSLDLKRVKMAMSEHNDKTLKPTATTQPPKKPLNKPKSDPLERKMQEDKQAASEPTIRPKSWPNKIEVKSRYLEPKKPVVKDATPQVPTEKVTIPQRRKIMISSSDSSRTSSPAMKRATDKRPLAKIKLPVKKDVKALSSDSLTETNKAAGKKDLISKSCGITRPESPSFKQKTTDIGLSADSLAESKKNQVPVRKKVNKMDTSMSTDSLMTELSVTPKSNVSNKLSPTLGKGVVKIQISDKAKKTSPPAQQRNPFNARRPLRSLESSTAASRSRAAAISAYHGSPNLRRNLLEAAKTPDVPVKTSNAISRVSSGRQATQVASPLARREKKDSSSNPQSSESPSKRSSPKSSAANGSNRITTTERVLRKNIGKTIEDKSRTKCHNGDTPKQPTVGSRSGTFLKDEPTILKKADIKTSQINIS